MYVQHKKEDCCGCSACMTMCPAKCITMKRDEEGFLYPEIDETKCLHCGMCQKVCDFNKIHDWDAMPQPKAYAAKQKSDLERAKSQSGGMFAALSDVVLEMGGVVYGAGYDEEWNVMHKRAETKEARDEMRGSKYVQSDMRDTFRRVLEDLSKGRTVLFSGTHCQCAGLKSLAEMRHARTEKLFLVDIVCHGVPSPKIYQAYMEFMKKKHRGEIERFNFRNKGKFGWHSHVESAIIKGKEYDTELYVDLFYGHNALRSSCHQCPYKHTVHVTDITVSDFWGIEKWAPDFDDNKGVSLVLLNTSKGNDLFETAKKRLYYREAQIKDCIQPPLQHPFPRPATRERFWRDFETKPFEYVLAHYTYHYGWRTYTKKAVKCVLKAVLPRPAIEVLKKLRGR